MSKSGSSFASFFGGTLGIFVAIAVFFIGLPILACGGCLLFGTAFAPTADTPRSDRAKIIAGGTGPGFLSPQDDPTLQTPEEIFDVAEAEKVATEQDAVTIPEEAVTDSSANFEALSEDIENRVSTDSDLPMQPKTERLNSEDQFFADRMEKYTQELKDWMAINDMQEALQLEMEGVKKELAEIDKNKPQPPAFEEREWVSVDKKFKLKASLVSTDYRTATLQKLDRTQVSVPRDKLCEGDRIYIEKAFDQLAPHRLSLAKWQKVRDAATERLQLLSLRATSTRLPGPKPELPTREDIANELKAEESLARQKHNEIENAQTRRIADERAAKLQAAKQLAETESNYDGLVLMRKTVSATLGGSNARISGVVENRRNTKLKYAQITFNLYDASGAQVGSAIDTITGLEPGGRWKFTATDFGIECVRFKFSELVGF